MCVQRRQLSQHLELGAVDLRDGPRCDRLMLHPHEDVRQLLCAVRTLEYPLRAPPAVLGGARLQLLWIGDGLGMVWFGNGLGTQGEGRGMRDEG